MVCGMLLDKKIINMNNIINKFLLAGDKPYHNDMIMIYA